MGSRGSCHDASSCAAKRGFAVETSRSALSRSSIPWKNTPFLASPLVTAVLLALLVPSAVAGSSRPSALQADSLAAYLSETSDHLPMTSRVLSLADYASWEGSVRRRLVDDVASTVNSVLSPEAVSQLVGRLRALRVRLGEVVTRANTTMQLLPGLDEENGAEGSGEGLESVKVVDVVDDDQTPLKLDWGRAVSKEQREKEEKDKQAQGRCPSDAQAGGGAGGAADVAAAHRLAAHADWRGGFANGSLAWAPEKDRYILMDCHRGRSSTRIRCFRNYMLLAGLSNRTLLVPMNTTEVASGYDRRIVFDFDHAWSHTPANFTINNTGADGGSRGMGWQKESEVTEIQDKRFVAVHWRRGEMGMGCKEPGVMCHVRAAQAAGCIARVMEKAGGIKTVFLVSDASPKELTEIRNALFQHIQDLRLVMLPPNLRGQKWAARLKSYDFQHQGLIVSTVDKCVAALADIFLGTAGSSFTLDIQRLRSGLRTASCEDSFICEGAGEHASSLTTRR
ncbi:unnamed protein product [Closterium sp. Yama58-4]|nr:unnamed protein product [Closterium sp. Yama58-4]